MNKLFVPLLSILLTIAGSDNLSDRLDRAEMWIDEAPASSLAILDSMDVRSIHKKINKARFSLLYSMALDRSDVKITSDSVISMAVAWYKRYGSDNDKLNTYYCCGRIFENRGDDKTAMEYYAKAEVYVGPQSDEISTGLLYMRIAGIAKEVFDEKEAFNLYSKACGFFEEVGDTNRYAATLSGKISCSDVLQDYNSVVTLLQEFKSLWPGLSSRNKNNYYQQIIGYHLAVKDYERARFELKEYVSVFDSSDVNWLNVSEYYLALGMSEESIDALQAFKKIHPEYKKEPDYFLLSSRLYEDIQDYPKALESYKCYHSLKDSVNRVIFDNDTEFIMERYEKDLHIERAKESRIIIVMFSVLVFCVLLYFTTRRIKKQKEENRRMALDQEMYTDLVVQLKKERDELRRTLSSSTHADLQSMNILQDRLELLNRLFVAGIAENGAMSRSAYAEVERLVGNRNEFLYTTRMTFSAAHPEFIEFLEEKNLDIEEIEYCCLLAIGLRVKEIGAYMNKSTYYNLSSDIRKKLGLSERDTNLSNYLKNLLRH